MIIKTIENLKNMFKVQFQTYAIDIVSVFINWNNGSRGRMASVRSLWFLLHCVLFFKKQIDWKVSEMFLPFSQLNDQWIVTEMRLKITVTIYSPFSHHSVTIQSNDRGDFILWYIACKTSEIRRFLSWSRNLIMLMEGSIMMWKQYNKHTK